MMKAIGLLLTVFALLGTAAELTQISGPTSGLLFDAQAKAIRPVVGVPGAAYLGRAIVTDVEAAAVAPGGKLAAVARNSRLSLVKGLDTEAPEWIELGDGSNVDRIAWSDDSALMAVARGSRLELWSRLGDTPESKVMETGIEGRVAAMAVSSGGDVVVAGESGAVWLVTGSKLLVQLEGPAGLALSAGRLYVTDRARGELLEIRGWSDSASVALVAAVEDAVGVAAVNDRLYVASGKQKSVTVLDTSGALLGRIDLDFEPSRLEHFNGSLFLLNSGGVDAWQMLSAGREAAVFFVPAGTEE